MQGSTGAFALAVDDGLCGPLGMTPGEVLQQAVTDHHLRLHEPRTHESHETALPRRYVGRQLTEEGRTGGETDGAQQVERVPLHGVTGTAVIGGG